MAKLTNPFDTTKYKKTGRIKTPTVPQPIGNVTTSSPVKTTTLLNDSSPSTEQQQAAVDAARAKLIAQRGGQTASDTLQANMRGDTTTTAPVVNAPVNNTMVNNTPQMTTAQFIEQQRLKSIQDSEAMRRAQIAQGQAGLQGALDDTNALLEQQTQSLDPRYGALKASSVAGTRVAQKRLSQLLPFSNAMAGSGVRSQVGIEAGLQQRQSDLDTTRSQEEGDIAFRGQQASRDFNTGLQQVQAGAQADQFARDIRSNETASAEVLRQREIQSDRNYQAELTEASRLETRELMALETEIDRENMLIEEEIREARAQNDQAREQQLLAQRQSNSVSLEAVKQANREKNATTSNNYASNVDTGLSNEKKSIILQDMTDNKKSKIETLIGQSNYYESRPDELAARMKTLGISADELDVYEEWRDSALADRPFQ